MTGSRLRPGEELLNAALRLLARRSRGVKELRGRLLKRGFAKEEVSDCLAWLQERDLLDDEAFSRALIRDRMKLSPRGSWVLKQELTRKGIAAPMAEKAVEEVFDAEGISDEELAETAARGWVRKQGSSLLQALAGNRFTEDREKARRSLYAFLRRRGFMGQATSRGLEAGDDEARILLSDME